MVTVLFALILASVNQTDAFVLDVQVSAPISELNLQIHFICHPQVVQFSKLVTMSPFFSRIHFTSWGSALSIAFLNASNFVLFGSFDGI